MNWLWGNKQQEKDQLVDMKLEDYLAKYPTLQKGGIHAEEIEKHASAEIEVGSHKMLVYKGNICKLHIDAIQNAANSSLMGGGGIDGAIHDGAGYSLHDECRKLGGCETGKSKITKGYNLPCATIIHTVGPVYSRYTPGICSHQLESCYRTTLELCDQYKLESVGLCCVSTGIYGYPLEEATHIAFQTVLNYLQANKETSSLKYVIFVVFLPKEHDAYNNIFNKYMKGEYKEFILPPIENPKDIKIKKKEEEIKDIDEKMEELRIKREKISKELEKMKEEREKEKEKENIGEKSKVNENQTTTKEKDDKPKDKTKEETSDKAEATEGKSAAEQSPTPAATTETETVAKEEATPAGTTEEKKDDNNEDDKPKEDETRKDEVVVAGSGDANKNEEENPNKKQKLDENK